MIRELNMKTFTYQNVCHQNENGIEKSIKLKRFNYLVKVHV